MDIHAKLQKAGFTMPQAAPPAANYVPYVLSGPHLFIAGQIPFIEGASPHLGRVGVDVSMDEAILCAQNCALNILAQVDAAVEGDWARVVRCVKLGGFVSCEPSFTDHPKVINGASDLMVAALGERGRHARFAVGAPSLPLNVPVEIDAIFEIRPA